MKKDYMKFIFFSNIAPLIRNKIKFYILINPISNKIKADESIYEVKKFASSFGVIWFLHNESGF